MWHYQFGSEYDTTFWKYAKSLPFKPDKEFQYILRQSRLVSALDARYLTEHHTIFPNSGGYSQWGIKNIKGWDDHVKWI